MARLPQYSNVKFVSICCDKLDGAREILEQEDIPKWNAIHHFFMPPEAKEQAKKLLGFKSVPFYVVLNSEGEVVLSSKQVDFENIPGIKVDEGKETVVVEERETAPVKTSSKARVEASSPTTVRDVPIAVEERVFALDEDF